MHNQWLTHFRSLLQIWYGGWFLTTVLKWLKANGNPGGHFFSWAFEDKSIELRTIETICSFKSRLGYFNYINSSNPNSKILWNDVLYSFHWLKMRLRRYIYLCLYQDHIIRQVSNSVLSDSLSPSCPERQISTPG
jgi:hypothetical protein